MAIPRMKLSSDDDEAVERPFINTGGPLDITNGRFIPTVNGGMALSGGLGLTTAFVAEANKFKSTCQNSCAINALARFPESLYKIYDSEYAAVIKDRLANMSDLYIEDPVARAAHIADLESRIAIFDPTTTYGESLDAWVDHLKEIMHEKVAHHKDYTVETELLDPETGQARRMLIPTFVGIDSWTEAAVRQLNVKNEEHNASTEMKDQRTINMDEGWQKVRLMRQLPTICAKGGINLLMTGHLGKKISMDGKPSKKELAYMGQDEALKGMGNKFLFTMSTIFKIGNTKPLVDKVDRHESEYPSSDHMSGTDLQELIMTVVRSKNSQSGAQPILVSSQQSGILSALSEYNYLRTFKYFGLGGPSKVRNPLLGDLNLGRTKIVDATKDYKVRRALELTYQLCVIQSLWSMRGQVVDYSIPIDTFAQRLEGSGYAIDDILNSRGWWTYKDAPGIDRPFLTLPDILGMISGTYKPKLFAVSTIGHNGGPPLVDKKKK